MWIHESMITSLYHYFKRDSAVPSYHKALSSSVPSSAIDSWPTTVIQELIIATNKLYTWFIRQGFYLLKLEVGAKIVVIGENLNSRLHSKIDLSRKYSTVNNSQHNLMYINAVYCECGIYRINQMEPKHLQSMQLRCFRN